MDNPEKESLYLCCVVNAFVDNVNKMMNKVGDRMNKGEKKIPGLQKCVQT